MNKARPLVWAPDEGQIRETPNLDRISFYPEYHQEIVSGRRKKEIDNLVTQMILKSRQRGRPKKMNHKEE